MNQSVYKGVTKSFRTDRLERELQMIQLSAIRYIRYSCRWENVKWIHLAQDRVHWRTVAKMAMKLGGP